MPQVLDPISQFQVIPSMGIYGDFETFSGGELDRTVVKHYGAGANSPNSLMGTHDYTDIVLTRAYVPIRDAVIFDLFVESAERQLDFPVQVTKRFSGPGGFVVGSESYECKIKSAQPPTGQAGDSSPAPFTVTLTVLRKL